MTFVDSSCLGRFLDSLNYTLFDGANAKKVHRREEPASDTLLWSVLAALK